MKKFILLSMILSIALCACPCTTFFINHNGEMVFGRNYDWVTGSGLVCTNLRGLTKTSMKVNDGKSITWTSRFGSITFNQYGKEFPTGGMNENGLVVELMWLDETKYAKEDDRPAIGVLQWIQYQLDNSATVNEVIASDKKVRVTATSAPLHYLVADATGNVATIEFLNGVLTVHQGNSLPFPVLTNSTYAESKQLGAPKAVANTGAFQNNSIERFSTACSMLKQFTDNKISIHSNDHAFSILDKVAQGRHTKWSIVYDLKNKRVRFKTLDYPAVKEVLFSIFDFSCVSKAKAFDMNQMGNNNISNKFIDFSTELNRKVVQRSVYESRLEVPIDDESREEILVYPNLINCNKVAFK